jgi:hypothetical protein
VSRHSCIFLRLFEVFPASANPTIFQAITFNSFIATLNLNVNHHLAKPFQPCLAIPSQGLSSLVTSHKNSQPIHENIDILNTLANHGDAPESFTSYLNPFLINKGARVNEAKGHAAQDPADASGTGEGSEAHNEPSNSRENSETRTDSES